MKPDKIRKIIGEKIKEVKKLSKKIDSDFKKDALHEFRVSVKSLRSFLRMLRMAQPDNTPKMPGKFKRLYQISGAIRDAQLELDQIATNKSSLPVYTDKLQNDISRQKKEWGKHYSDKVFKKMKKRLAGCDYDALSPDALAAFHHVKMTGVKKLGKSVNATNSQVHNIRKNVKDILYTTKLAEKKWAPALSQMPPVQMDELDHIASMIGDYNDERIQLEHLNSFHSPKTELAELNTIKKIVKKEDAKLTAGKKQILNVVNKFSGKRKAKN
jgi:CHAD domain-containing protein